jgi:hypothetical protein
MFSGKDGEAGRLERGDAVDTADLLLQFDHVRAEHTDHVQGRGEQRLQDLVRDRLGGVPHPAQGHLGDRRGRGPAPGPQVGPDAVGGEQLPVVGQIEDGLGGSASDPVALLSDDDAFVIDDVAPMPQVGLAVGGLQMFQDLQFEVSIK